MEGNGEEIPETNEQEDESEDYSTFFLQPASSPYNIAQKVEEANVALFNSSIKSEKSPRVRFKDDLVSFDAQLTDDDVVSIESDNVDVRFIEQPNEQSAVIFEYKTNKPNKIFSIDEDEEDEIIEEIESEMEQISKNQHTNLTVELKKIEKQILHSPEVKKVEEIVKSVEEQITDTKKGKVKKPLKLPKFIDCKYHCIERIDTDLPSSMKKLLLKEKPSICPPLKLIDRKCCTENIKKNPISLPKYNGFRSEYGLNIEQIERRQKIQDMIRTREEKRQELLDEYKKKKDEINEEVFCKWLKNISERTQKIGFNEFRASLRKTKEPYHNRPAPRIRFPHRNISSSKTTSDSGFSSRNSSEKCRRPKSSDHSVFVEVPKRVLQRGINLEFLLNDFKNHSKKLFITTVS